MTDSAVLWNAAEAAEKRKVARVFREIVLALAADRVLTTEHRIELTRALAREHFASKDLSVGSTCTRLTRSAGEAWAPDPSAPAALMRTGTVTC